MKFLFNSDPTSIVITSIKTGCTVRWVTNLAPGGNLQLGYMQQFIVKGDGLSAERSYTLQVSLTYNVDFR